MSVSLLVLLYQYSTYSKFEVGVVEGNVPPFDWLNLSVGRRRQLAKPRSFPQRCNVISQPLRTVLKNRVAQIIDGRSRCLEGGRKPGQA